MPIPSTNFKCADSMKMCIRDSIDTVLRFHLQQHKDRMDVVEGCYQKMKRYRNLVSYYTLSLIHI